MKRQPRNWGRQVELQNRRSDQRARVSGFAFMHKGMMEFRPHNAKRPNSKYMPHQGEKERARRSAS